MSHPARGRAMSHPAGARLLVALLLGALCAGAGAVEIRTYDTRVDVGADGSARARVDLALTGVAAGRLRVPVGFPALDGFKVEEAPAGVAVKPLPSKEQSAVEIELPEGVPADVALRFAFTTPGVLVAPKPEEGQKSKFPEGSRLLRHVFVNTQPAPVGRYRVEVLLPPESMVQTVREQLPRPGRKEFVPRVELDRLDGRQGAVLQLSGVRQGGRTSMELEVVRDRRSLLWLVVGMTLACGWLVAYRFVVRPPPG